MFINEPEQDTPTKKKKINEQQYNDLWDGPLASAQ